MRSTQHSAPPFTARELALGAAVDAVAPRAAELADATERGRRLAAPLVEAYGQGGVFGMFVPEAYGGVEARPAVALEAVERLARADGSAGWCAMIAATAGLLAAWLEPSAAREVFASDPRAAAAGVFAPMGRARAARGGYVLDGRWSFASGCEHSAWIGCGAVLFDGDAPRTDAAGVPATRMLVFPRADFEVIDTWDTAGLRGTGSHDVAVRGLFVPDARVVALGVGAPAHDAALYRVPVFGLLALGVAAVSLGVARHAIDALTELAARKVPAGARAPLARRALVQYELARAEGALRAARALVYQSADDAFARAHAGEGFALEHRASMRLAAAHAAQASAAVVDAMYSAGGGAAIYSTSPLQRCFRDAHVATQHVMVAPTTLELVGRALLGLDADTALL